MSNKKQLNNLVEHLNHKCKCNNSIIIKDSFEEFPTKGKSNTLYIDKDTGTIYIWDGSSYQSIGGSGNDANYVYNQAMPSDTWSITHNLGKYPSVTIIDSSGNEVIGGVNFPSINNVILTFSVPFSGKATLN